MASERGAEVEVQRWRHMKKYIDNNILFIQGMHVYIFFDWASKILYCLYLDSPWKFYHAQLGGKVSTSCHSKLGCTKGQVYFLDDFKSTMEVFGVVSPG